MYLLVNVLQMSVSSFSVLQIVNDFFFTHVDIDYIVVYISII